MHKHETEIKIKFSENSNQTPYFSQLEIIIKSHTTLNLKLTTPSFRKRIIGSSSNNFPCSYLLGTHTYWTLSMKKKAKERCASK
jgi:hypothetical protein